ncbi:MAG: carbamoyltransferase HypF [Gallionellaceae bacterium]|nr:MAG: carbamoyltransferase HypF [Gallionellaceae bacterium]
MPKRTAIVPLPYAGPSILACGAWLKNTICVTCSNEAHISPLIGDLDSVDARLMLEETVLRLCAELEVRPEIVAHDLHPDFFSTQFAQVYAVQHGLASLPVQHHHAHIAALCAEHGITEAVLGVALDGVGLGEDNMPWGGELLRVQGAAFQRVGHLAALAMPGGDRAAREPWRMAAATLFQMGRGDEIAQRFASQPGAQTVLAMLQRGLNCPSTSSMGRLFDAAAGLLGLCEVQSIEAQAAMQLQALAEQHGMLDALPDGYRIGSSGELDFAPLLAVLADAPDVGYGAALFHATLAAGLSEWVLRAAGIHHIRHVALGGGCFHNALLLQALSAKLAAQGLRVLTAQQLPPDDSAISLGQAWVAMQSYTQGI